MLPTAGVNRVFGLLDLLKAYNGKTDVANLTIDLRMDVDELLPIIDTAEYMGLVSVKEGEIALTDLGKKTLNSKIAERKKIVHDTVRNLEPFSDLVKLLKQQNEVNRLSLARYVTSKYGHLMDLPSIVNTIISWGVFSGLFGYDGQSGKLLPRAEENIK